MGHYARFPKFDRGGSLLWRHTPNWRRTCDLATLGWLIAFVATACLTLVGGVGVARGAWAAGGGGWVATGVGVWVVGAGVGSVWVVGGRNEG